jgi:hypothetical protein
VRGAISNARPYRNSHSFHYRVSVWANISLVLLVGAGRFERPQRLMRPWFFVNGIPGPICEVKSGRMVCSVNILPFVDDLLARCRATLDCMGYAVIVADLESRITLFKGKVTIRKKMRGCGTTT